MNKWQANKDFWMGAVEDYVFPNRDEDKVTKIENGDFIYEFENVYRLIVRGRRVEGNFSDEWKSQCTLIVTMPEDELGGINYKETIGFSSNSISEIVSFSTEDEKDLTVIIPSKLALVTNARLGISSVGSPTALNVIVTNFSSEDRHSSNANSRFQIVVARTQLSSDVSSGVSTITVDDSDDFSQDDLIRLTNGGGSSELVRVSAVTGNDIHLENPLQNNYLLGDNVNRFGEFGDLLWADNDSDSNYEMFLKFQLDSPTTVDLVLNLLYFYL